MRDAANKGKHIHNVVKNAFVIVKLVDVTLHFINLVAHHPDKTCFVR